MLTLRRHDNDRKLPRTPSEIYELNRAVAAKMQRIFTSRNIPVVPSLGALVLLAAVQPPSESLINPLLTSGNNDVWRAFLLLLSIPGRMPDADFLAHV